MEESIYKKSGHPLGFVQGDIIYNLGGRALGQLRDTHVYTRYVGELEDGMILDKNRNYGSVGSRSAGSGGSRGLGARGARGTSYSDKSDELFGDE